MNQIRNLRNFIDQKNKFTQRMLITLAKDRLEDFREYTFDIESKFHTDKKKIASRYEELSKEFPEDRIDELYEDFSVEYGTIEETFIGMYRKSTLVSIYSFLEDSLNSLCKHLYSMHKYPITLDDLAGKGIVRAKVYLEKLAKVDFSKINTEWTDLSTLIRIRNCIIHCDGDIESSTKYTKLGSPYNRVEVT